MPAALVGLKRILGASLDKPILEGGAIDDDIVGHMRAALARRKEEGRRRLRQSTPRKKDEKSDGEIMSQLAAYCVEMVPLHLTREDPDFTDIRINDDPLHPEWAANEGQKLSDLEESMDAEGIKIPIVVQISDDGESLLVRAGSRRRKTAMKLGWQEIPAIILPSNVPFVTVHWLNILENLTRKTVSTYEIAVKAKLMRDDFDVTPSEFARKTGFSISHVCNLLGCIDRLPPYLIEQWKMGARIALDQWISLSHLEHEQAIKFFQRWIGLTPKDRMRAADANERRKPLPPPRWLDRMQRLYIGVEGSDLEPRTRSLAIKVIEFCMGMSNDVPGVYEPRKQKMYERKARMRAELRMPEVPLPGEEKEMPPPVEMLEDGR